MILTDRMEPEALAAYERLPYHQQSDVVQFLQNNPRKHLCDAQDIVDAWLVWNGMIGYTSNIVEVVRYAYGDVGKKGVAG